MTATEIKLKQLQIETRAMWQLICSQLLKTKECFLKLDKDLAREIILNERRITACELKIDIVCENILTLFNPLSADLRYVLSVLKINLNLERIGENVECIAKFVLNIDKPVDKKLIKISRIVEMFNKANNMLCTIQEAFIKEDATLARTIFKKDEALDLINLKSNLTIVEFIRNNKNCRIGYNHE